MPTARHPSAPAQTLAWSGRSDIGKRKNNEDSFLGLRFDAREVQRLGKFGSATNADMDYVFAVSDGMGGAKAGEYASRIAVDKITALLPKSFKMSAAGLESGADDVLETLYDQIHKAIVYLGASYEECHGMEATLSLAWFSPGWMHFAHVGDSRIYYLPKEGKLRQLTEDDTHVAWLLRNKHITEYQARTHPARNVLQKALGGGNQFVNPQLGRVAYEPGDQFLLCTDGLTAGLFDNSIEEYLRDPSVTDISSLLVAESVSRDGKDNTTALVVRISD